MRAAKSLCWIIMLCGLVGCSSAGDFSLWPPSFPLLQQTKQVAAQTPVSMCLPRELSEQPVHDYFVEPGDRLLIESVKLNSELQLIGEQLVPVDGSIDLGEYGRLRVAGLTVEMIEAAISNHLQLATDQPEIVNVQLVETNAAIFYVLGEVGSPGAYELAGRELVLDGILRAGGLTSQASPCNIVLVRPTGPCQRRVVLPVCYRQITQLGDTTTNYQLQPGDRIVVAARTICEELAFWRQSKPCKCCGPIQCPEKQPCSVTYDNRFTRQLSPFPLPLMGDETKNATKDISSESRTSEAYPDASTDGVGEIDKKKESIDPLDSNEPSPADEEFFLPPLKQQQ